MLNIKSHNAYKSHFGQVSIFTNQFEFFPNFTSFFPNMVKNKKFIIYVTTAITTTKTTTTTTTHQQTTAIKRIRITTIAINASPTTHRPTPPPPPPPQPHPHQRQHNNTTATTTNGNSNTTMTTVTTTKQLEGLQITKYHVDVCFCLSKQNNQFTWFFLLQNKQYSALINNK